MQQRQNIKSERLAEVAKLFLKLGLIAFGGPAAHIAMMEQEVVRRRRWLTHEEFLDLLGATNLIPGPNSTEMAIHIGYRRAGWLGLMIGGICFILPAAIIVGMIAWAYVRFGKLPQVEGALYGIKPVVIAIVIQALWSLGRTAIKSKGLAVIGLSGLVLNFLGVNELLILFGTGLFVMASRSIWRRDIRTLLGFPILGVPGASLLSTGGVAVAFSLGTLFLFFLKVGSVLFGSGYVLLAFLRADLVERWHWLNENQLMDAIAVGQFTPGPVLTTATFIGYILGGWMGAGVATMGIFLPAFIFVAITNPFLARLRQSLVVGGFLDGVNVASLALMAVVSWQLGAGALVDWLSILLAVITLFLLLRFRINSAWLVLSGAVVGILIFLWK